MDFKFISVPEGTEFSEKELAFLGAIEKGIEAAGKDKVNADEIRKEIDEKLQDMANSQNLDVIQKQLDRLWEKTDQANQKPKRDIKKDEKEFNQKWVQAFLKRDKDEMKRLEKEAIPWGGEASGLLHTGPLDGEDAQQGSYLIPELFLAEVQRYVEEYGVARREMRYLPFSGPGNERVIPTLLSSVTIDWIGEGERKPKSKPKFERVIQKLKKLAVIVVMTEEIIEDSAIDLIALTSQLIGEAFVEEEDSVFLAGDTNAGDPFDGILYANGVQSIELEDGEVVTDLTPDKLNEIVYSVQTAARAGAKWYMHPSVFGVLQRYRASAVAAGDAEGVYLIQEPAGGQPARIWGYEVVLSDVLPDADTTDVDTPFMFFGNLQRTCVYGDKLGLRIKMLDQASYYDTDGNVVNLAENDLVAIRAMKRVGYVPVLPGGIAVLQTGSAT